MDSDTSSAKPFSPVTVTVNGTVSPGCAATDAGEMLIPMSGASLATTVNQQRRRRGAVGERVALHFRHGVHLVGLTDLEGAVEHRERHLAAGRYRRGAGVPDRRDATRVEPPRIRRRPDRRARVRIGQSHPEDRPGRADRRRGRLGPAGRARVGDLQVRRRVRWRVDGDGRRGWCDGRNCRGRSRREHRDTRQNHGQDSRCQSPS